MTQEIAAGGDGTFQGRYCHINGKEFPIICGKGALLRGRSCSGYSLLMLFILLLLLPGVDDFSNEQLLA